ncbi:MAG TPA: fructosamine kinase family protein [Chitinophagaceae bacterium]|nr:fructosamine kinase family protein [Chitinophagaceae bacterium]
MISIGLVRAFESGLSGLSGMKITIKQVLPVSGGDINSCFRLDAGSAQFFLKLNQAGQYPDMFEKEFRGLEMLKKQKVAAVPEPLITGILDNKAWLITEWVEKGKPVSGFWDDFAIAIASLHYCSQENFGLKEDNYIGTIPQSNQYHAKWAGFFGEKRIHPLIKMAVDRNLMEKNDKVQAENLCNRLEEVFPEEKPALLHGDLWSGNFIVAKNGSPCIFDPAVYYGHREMDLAMTRLFGGFDTRFYSSYDRYYPLMTGWKKRVGICQLYPLMVHLILFGRSYLSAIKETLKPF